jgi:NTE family protein
MTSHRPPQGSENAPLNALVLGGGGPVGASWTSALLHGLRAAGLPPAECDIVMGTSAGAVVGAWLMMQPDGLPSVPELMRKRAAWHAGKAKADHGDSSATAPISADQAEALWKANLPEGPWPRGLAVMSVNTGTGDAHAWSAEDGISLAVAVACSTAAPGAAPPVALGDAVWVDGGVRSGTNADLLVDAGSGLDRIAYGTGPGRVLMVAPLASDKVAREEAILVERGHSVRVIVADPFYKSFADLLDPGFIDIATAAGASQARAAAAELANWWRA